MNCDQLKEFYIKLNGSEPKWHTFFESTPDEQSIFVPGYTFEIENDVFCRGVARLQNGDEIVVQDEVEETLPDKMQRAAIIKSLSQDGILPFCASLIAGRMAEADEICEIILQDDSLKFIRYNLEFVLTKQTLMVKQNDMLCKELEIAKTQASLQDLCDALLDISMPAMAFIGQEELLDSLKEKYPDFCNHIIKEIDYLHDNSVSYHITVPSPTDEDRLLWIIIQQYDVTVGINGLSLCDDIGLHIDAVSKYVDAIIDEKTILINEYKNKKAFDNKELRQTTWMSAPESAQVLEDKYAKKTKGLQKLANKGKIVDIFSWNGTYSMTLEL